MIIVFDYEMDSSGLSTAICIQGSDIQINRFEPEASRVQGGRSTVELRAHDYENEMNW